MSTIFLKFKPYFEEPMLAGIKLCTARKKRMGEPGDLFEAFGAMFQLGTIEQKRLWEVKSLWREEGCKSAEHFVEVWNEIHPRAGYREYELVYLHWFRKVA